MHHLNSVHVVSVTVISFYLFISNWLNLLLGAASENGHIHIWTKFPKVSAVIWVGSRTPSMEISVQIPWCLAENEAQGLSMLWQHVWVRRERTKLKIFFFLPKVMFLWQVPLQLLSDFVWLSGTLPQLWIRCSENLENKFVVGSWHVCCVCRLLNVDVSQMLVQWNCWNFAWW